MPPEDPPKTEPVDGDEIPADPPVEPTPTAPSEPAPTGSPDAPPEPEAEPEPEPPPPRHDRTRTYVTLALRPAGRLHKVLVDPRRFNLRNGDLAVVETDRGLAIARVLIAPQEEAGVKTSNHVRKVVRPAREPDLLTHSEGKARETELLDEAKAITRRSGVAIEVLGVDFQAIGNKLTLFFAAEKRVDFRALVRDLSQGLAVRVEMRQIGVRDEAKLFGALGHCGRELCCSTWLRDFGAVSIRMAKTQNLALSPNKVSGLCGRLMCCLAYEHEAYSAASKNLPKSGKRVLTCKGPGKVMSIDVLGQKFSFLGDDGAREVMEPADVARDEDGRPQRPPPRGAPQPPESGDDRKARGGPRRSPERSRPTRTGRPPRSDKPEPEQRPAARPERGPEDRPATKAPDGKERRRRGPRRSRKGRTPTGGEEPKS